MPIFTAKEASGDAGCHLRHVLPKFADGVCQWLLCGVRDACRGNSCIANDASIRRFLEKLHALEHGIALKSLQTL